VPGKFDHLRKMAVPKSRQYVGTILHLISNPHSSTSLRYGFNVSLHYRPTRIATTALRH